MDQSLTGGETLRSLLTALSNEQFSRRRAESMTASQVISEVFKRNGPLRMRPQGVKSAAFRVLMNYTMPAVLVECGFLDHPSDAALLVQPGVQEEIATQLFNAINLYFSRTDPDFQAHLASPHFAVFKEAADKWRVDGIQGSARGSVNIYPTDAEWR